MNNTNVMTKQEEERLDDILSVYRNVYNAVSIIAESVIQLGKLNVVDEDIERINAMENPKTSELMKLVGDIEYFKEHSEKIFDSLV